MGIKLYEINSKKLIKSKRNQLEVVMREQLM